MIRVVVAWATVLAYLLALFAVAAPQIPIEGRNLTAGFLLAGLAGRIYLQREEWR